MNYFGKDGKRAYHGARAILGMTAEALAMFPSDKEVKLILSVIEPEVDALDEVAARRIQERIKPLRLTSELAGLAALAARGQGTSLALRVIECCTAAVITESRGDELGAWKWLASGGINVGILLREASNSAHKSDVARRAHTEDDASKLDVFNWLDHHAHTYRFLDRIAEAVAEKVVPHKLRTVRGWISEWHGLAEWKARKKLRPAS